MNYLISGYYGEKNAGDEAILAGILQEIERRDVDARFAVLSFDPADTERRHYSPGRDLRALPTSLRSPSPLRAAMKQADLLISGGGSFLHEADFELHGRSFLLRGGKLRPIPYFLTVVLMARTAGLPVMWYAQGLGPLHTRLARRLVARAGSVSQVVTWRDKESAALAYEVGVRAAVQLVVPDPAYVLISGSALDARETLAAAGLAAMRRYLAVCPRAWLGRSGYLENLGAALEAAAASLDLDILLLPFHELHDPPVCENLAARPGFAGRAHTLPPVESPALLAAILGSAELVVAMRLHGGILSASAGTPAVVIDYDPKTKAFAKQTGQTSWAIDVDDLEDPARADTAPGHGGSIAAGLAAGAQRLYAAIMDTASKLEDRRAALATAVAPLRAEAGRTAQLAVQLASQWGTAAT
ncbi:MAG: polysaccharide pyruvyl transferase family protein [Actinobacteria bacterium]|nr:polysaccharide pyruvyl transferase family protein [Actinomycetota bacterium]